MTLQEFYDHLSFGELAQYSFGTDNEGRISDKDYPRVNSFINLGLTRTHSELPLKMSALTLSTNPAQVRYELRSDAPWVSDLHEPFEDNILVISEILDEEGNALVLGEDCVSVHGKTVTYNGSENRVFTVTFQASHAKLPLSRRIDPNTIELDIPDVIVEPLMLFVASKVLGSGGNAESIQEGQMKLSQYEQLIQQIEDNGVVESYTPTSLRKHDQGWV